MKLILWVKALSRWIVEPRPFWLCVFVMAASLYIAFAGPASELRIRILGLFLQLSGVTAVAWGLRETRKLFECPSLLDRAADWVGRFPKYKPSPVSGEAHLTLPGRHGSGSGYDWQSPGADAPIEKRLVAIEANLLDVNQRLVQVQQRLNHETRRITSELHEERLLRNEEDEVTRRKLFLAQTGGLSISAMGLVWLFSGLILSTASKEIAEWLA
jgi:hypothetical protein